MDVTDPRSIQSAVKVVANLSKRLDLLVNNAAILPDKSDSPLKTNAEEIRQAIETNTIGPYLVSRAFLPLLLKAESPRIINVSSGAGTLSASQTFAPAYSISKTALNAVTNQFAAALANKVAVNAVCPGWVRTEMGGRNAPRSIEEGVDGILWLATEAPSNISGLFFRDRKPIPW
jgi:NAD(P)-dependent dehydrogenase (short-subunit alcohol dehydrogenase family)